MKHKEFAVTIRGGMARGIGSLSIIRFFEEEGLKPTIVAGSSSGAMIASAYSLGYTYQEIREIFKSLYVKKLINPLNLLRGRALISKSSYYKQLEKITGIKAHTLNLESFTDPKLILLATDRLQSQQVLLDSGDLVENLMISSSYPIIMPAPSGKFSHLVDGDFVPGYAAGQLKDRGVEVVIGIGYTMGAPKKSNLKNTPFMRAYDIYRTVGVELQKLVNEKDPPDIELLYDAGDHSYFDFQSIDKILYRSYREIRSKRKQILHLLKN